MSNTIPAAQAGASGAPDYAPSSSAGALEQELLAMLERLNTSGAHSLMVPDEYLEVIIGKRPS